MPVPAKSAKSIQFDTVKVDYLNAMWCRQCRQDVPGSPSGGADKYTCPRCGNALRAELPLAFGFANEQPRVEASGGSPTGSQRRPAGMSEQSGQASGSPSQARGSPATRRPPETASASTSGGKEKQPEQLAAAVSGCEIIDWEQEDELLEIGRALKVDQPQRRKTGTTSRHCRVDRAHQTTLRRHSRQTPQPAQRSAVSSRTTAVTSIISWTAISLGVMALVCGGVLVGWSILGGRNDLWGLGIPIALGGQFALLLGLVLQLDRLWADSRNATAKLEQVDNKLRELKQTTTLLGTGHGTPAAFYAHFAEGASPSLLLSDLKSQLDLLALKLSNED